MLPTTKADPQHGKEAMQEASFLNDRGIEQLQRGNEAKAVDCFVASLGILKSLLTSSACPTNYGRSDPSAYSNGMICDPEQPTNEDGHNSGLYPSQHGGVLFSFYAATPSRHTECSMESKTLSQKGQAQDPRGPGHDDQIMESLLRFSPHTIHSDPSPFAPQQEQQVSWEPDDLRLITACIIYNTAVVYHLKFCNATAVASTSPNGSETFVLRKAQQLYDKSCAVLQSITQGGPSEHPQGMHRTQLDSNHAATMRTFQMLLMHNTSYIKYQIGDIDASRQDFERLSSLLKALLLQQSPPMLEVHEMNKMLMNIMLMQHMNIVAAAAG